MNINLAQIKSIEDKAQTVLVTCRTDAKIRLYTMLNRWSEQLNGSIPLIEQLSWAAKAEAAHAHQAGTATKPHLQILSVEAQETGETLSDLARRILSNASACRLTTSFIAGIRRKYTTRIEAASSPAEIETLMIDLQADLDRFSEVR
jgi:hypothetical protein